MNAQPSSYPTTSDISRFMRDLGFQWSNDGQIYFGTNYQHIEKRVAEYMYERLIGREPYQGQLSVLNDTLKQF